uniref:Uncharacterized protein n=1 Tax=Anguilla anguilla TaxID=7936 RepID=A0A0E9TB38_ANGAN
MMLALHLVSKPGEALCVFKVESFLHGFYFFVPFRVEAFIRNGLVLSCTLNVGNTTCVARTESPSQGIERGD